MRRSAQPLGGGITVRAKLFAFGLVATGVFVLVALAPWLNPCTGPFRFVNCVQWENSRVSNALAPWLFCPFGVCDYFPSAWTIAIKLFVKASIIGTVGFLASRVAAERKAFAGVGAAIATLVGFVVLTGLIYVRPAA
jgi:hypothetical protein